MRVSVFVVKIFFGHYLWTIFVSLQLKNNSFLNSAIKFGLWVFCRVPNRTCLRKGNFRIKVVKDSSIISKLMNSYYNKIIIN